MIPSAEFAPALTRYSERFHRVAGSSHHVASPLGAWILLALASTASRGDNRAELSRILGMDVDAAAELSAKLLGNPHEAVAAAAAAWTRSALSTKGLTEWVTTLPIAVACGEVPSKKQLDSWAKEKTLGLIEEFPGTPTNELVLLLATALATRVKWRKPFKTTSGKRLGQHSAWSALQHVLMTPGAVRTSEHVGYDASDSHVQFIAPTGEAGDVAVHAARSADGLLVASVIADQRVPAQTVLQLAHRFGMALATNERVPRRSLHELPLGESPLWTVSESMGPVEGDRPEYCSALLPSWTASSSHDLAGPELGYSLAARGLSAATGIEPFILAASQMALARYGRQGFEAAAVTSFFATLGRPSMGMRREAELRFGHPYAVVAVATESPRWNRESAEMDFGPWHGVPMFSAWVTEAVESEPEPEPKDEPDYDELIALDGDDMPPPPRPYGFMDRLRDLFRR